MEDNIIMKRIWQDADFCEIEIECRSKSIVARSKFYITDFQLDELYNKIDVFLLGKEDQVFWQSGTRGDLTTPCISFLFSRKDRLGHIQIETYMEIDDGGPLSMHNCCFFLITEYGLLHRFKDEVIKLRCSEIGVQISLRHSTGDSTG